MKVKERENRNAIANTGLFKRSSSSKITVTKVAVQRRTRAISINFQRASSSEVLNQCFLQWVETLVGSMGGEIIPIDGKTIRGSYDRNQGQSALHVISAWASEQRLVLAQVKVEDKSNEITEIPALLELLDITGAIITIDAMGTQTEIAKQIVAKKADYVLALKANHPTLHSQVQQWFETEKANNFRGVDVSYDKRIEKAHHRREIREVWTVPVAAIGELYQPKLWAGLKTLVMVVRVRHLWNKTTREVQFYLTSLNSDAQLIGQLNTEVLAQKRFLLCLLFQALHSLN